MAEKLLKTGYDAHRGELLRSSSAISNAGVSRPRLISTRDADSRSNAHTKGAAKKIWGHGSPPLSADDVECLWAIARRAMIQDRLVRARGKYLQDVGLIVISHGWPVLTANGRKLLDDLSTRMTLNLYREAAADPDSPEALV